MKIMKKGFKLFPIPLMKIRDPRIAEEEAGREISLFCAEELTIPSRWS